jgi:hypothetical protein
MLAPSPRSTMKIMEATLWPPVIPTGIPFATDGRKDRVIFIRKIPCADNYVTLTLLSRSGHLYNVNLVLSNGYPVTVTSDTVFSRIRSARPLTLGEVGTLDI